MRDAACPVSTRGGTRLVRLVRGRGGRGRTAAGERERPLDLLRWCIAQVLRPGGAGGHVTDDAGLPRARRAGKRGARAGARTTDWRAAAGTRAVASEQTHLQRYLPAGLVEPLADVLDALRTNFGQPGRDGAARRTGSRARAPARCPGRGLAGSNSYPATRIAASMSSRLPVRTSSHVLKRSLSAAKAACRGKSRSQDSRVGVPGMRVREADWRRQMFTLLLLPVVF